MAHWRDALQVLWRVLWHGLPVVEPKVREVVRTVILHGDEVELYRLVDEGYLSRVRAFGYMRRDMAAMIPEPKPRKFHFTYYRTCEEAFAAAAGEAAIKVERVAAIHCDGRYYERNPVHEYKLAPKPKKAKGARK